VEKQVPQATAQVIENLHPLREAGPFRCTGAL